MGGVRLPLRTSFLIFVFIAFLSPRMTTLFLSTLFLLPVALALPTSSSALEPPMAQPVVAASPTAVLACLQRHRYTALACTGLTVDTPPPPPPQCSSGDYGSVCHYGQGRCAYDAVRGYYCLCEREGRLRGLSRPSASGSGMAPDCIDPSAVESAP